MEFDISEILDVVPQDSSMLLCSSSFDKRWEVLPSILHSKMKVFVLPQSNRIEEINLSSQFQYELLELDYSEAFKLWKGIAEKVISLIEEANTKVTVDITALDPEALLFLVNQITTLKLNDMVKFIYLGADSYSKAFMSGVKSLRTVLGYPGMFSPSKKYHHLIVLLGFELDRAKELILKYEPSSISLGIGTDCYKTDFLEQNRVTSEKVHQFVESLGHIYKSISEFSFSSKDAIETKKSIMDEAIKFPDSNVLISPMNTKVSTVGAALAALENDELKLCYVEPLEFDIENYAEPGSVVTCFKV